MKYLLDTDTCIFAMKDRGGVKQRMAMHSPGDIALSVIVEAELRTGVTKSASSAKARRILEGFLAPLAILEMTSEDVEVYAQVRAKLEKQGMGIGPFDTLIAAHAVSRKLILVTNNVREHRRVTGLRIENWV